MYLFHEYERIDGILELLTLQRENNEMQKETNDLIKQAKSKKIGKSLNTMDYNSFHVVPLSNEAVDAINQPTLSLCLKRLGNC